MQRQIEEMNDTTCTNAKCASTNQKHYSDLGSDASSVHNLRRHFAGKPEVSSRSFGCFHRLNFHVYARPFILCFWFIYSRKMLRARTLKSGDVGNPPCGIRREMCKNSQFLLSNNVATSSHPIRQSHFIVT